MTGIEPRPQRWEARVLPLCHRGTLLLVVVVIIIIMNDNVTFIKYKINKIYVVQAFLINYIVYEPKIIIAIILNFGHK